MTEYSKVKEVSFELLDIIDSLVQPQLTNPLYKYVWNSFAMNRGKQIIINKPDEELKQMMKVSFDKMKCIFSEIEIADTIIESRTLNEGPQQDFIEKINKDVLELIPDGL